MRTSRRTRRGTIFAATVLVSVGTLVGTHPAVAAAPRTDPSQTLIEAPAFAAQRGISLADAEARLSWQDVAPDLAAHLAADLPTRFGGLWIATTHGDRVEVGVTGAADATTVAYVTREANAVGLATGFDVVPVARTQTTLDSDMDWLGDQIATVNTGATVMLSGGERTDINALDLDLPATGTLTSAQAALVVTAQRRLGGELLTTQAGQPFGLFDCISFYCDPPLRGGIRIIGPKSPCSAAFIAQSVKDGSLFLLTAGHCAYLQYTNWSTKFSDKTPTVIGPDFSWYYNSQDDEAALSVADPATWQPAGYVQVTKGAYTSEDQKYFIKAAKGNVVGMHECATGSYWGASTCGTVNEVNVTATLTDQGGANPLTAKHLGESTTCGIYGDSGAPLWGTHNAYGIIVGGKPSNSPLHPDDCLILFRSILRAQQTLGVTIVTATS